MPKTTIDNSANRGIKLTQRYAGLNPYPIVSLL